MAKYDKYLSLGSRAVYGITYGHHGINESNRFIMWRVLKWEMRWDKVWPSQAHVFCNPIGFIQQPTWVLSSWSTRGNWWGRDGPHFNFFLECFKIACFILGDDCTYIHMHVWKAHCFVAFIKSKWVIMKTPRLGSFIYLIGKNQFARNDQIQSPWEDQCNPTGHQEISLKSIVKPSY